jgi:hypothetical protein
LTSSIDRREAIRRISVALGATVSAPTVAALLSGCEVSSSPEPYVSRTLVDGRLRSVEALAEAVIPETDTPGASAARVHEFIDVMLTDFYPVDERARLLDGLAEVEAEARARFGSEDLVELSAADLETLVAELDAAAYPGASADPAAADADAEAATEAQRAGTGGRPPFWRTFKELVVAGYYTSEIGQTVELRLMPFGDFDGDVPYEEVGRSWA